MNPKHGKTRSASTDKNEVCKSILEISFIKNETYYYNDTLIKEHALFTYIFSLDND